MSSQGAAYVEFDVHLSKDNVPIIYHDLTCCISTKTVNELMSCPLHLLSLLHARLMQQFCFFLSKCRIQSSFVSPGTHILHNSFVGFLLINLLRFLVHRKMTKLLGS